MESFAHIDNLYSPLNESTSEIRLLRILPSKDIVRCSLSKATLSEEYRWGNANDTKNIEVNGIAFPATRHLVAFFHRFLRGGKTPGVDKWGELLP